MNPIIFIDLTSPVKQRQTARKSTAKRLTRLSFYTPPSPQSPQSPNNTPVKATPIKQIPLAPQLSPTTTNYNNLIDNNSDLNKTRSSTTSTTLTTTSCNNYTPRTKRQKTIINKIKQNKREINHLNEENNILIDELFEDNDDEYENDNEYNFDEEEEIFKFNNVKRELKFN